MYQLNIYKFGMLYFNHVANHKAYKFNKEDFINSVINTIETLEDYNCLDSRCFSWFFSSNSSKDFDKARHSISLFLDTMKAFDVFKKCDTPNMMVFQTENYLKDIEESDEFIKLYSVKVFNIINLFSRKEKINRVMKKINKLKPCVQNKKKDVIENIKQRLHYVNYMIDENAREAYKLFNDFYFIDTNCLYKNN